MTAATDAGREPESTVATFVQPCCTKSRSSLQLLSPSLSERQTLCFNSKPIHYVEHSKRVGRAAELTHERRQNCAMTMQRTNSEVCYALVLDFVVESGAQIRNRTSDTRIFKIWLAGKLLIVNVN